MTERLIAVAGHCCVDIIPTFDTSAERAEAALTPGKLVHVGPADFATGGPVPNVGLALLSTPTQFGSSSLSLRNSFTGLVCCSPG